MEKQEYIPGMCNINKAEVAYRKKAMWFGVGLTAILFLIMVGLNLSVWLRLVLILPILIAAIGYLQVKNRFCVAYGGSGKQNATDGNDVAEAVTDKQAIAKDKAKTNKMYLQAIIISVVVLALLMLVPNFSM